MELAEMPQMEFRAYDKKDGKSLEKDNSGTLWGTADTPRTALDMPHIFQ